MSGVKRQRVFWDDGGETIKRFHEVDCVLASDYDKLEEKCQRLISGVDGDIAEIDRIQLAYNDEFRKARALRAERDTLRAQVEAMREQLKQAVLLLKAWQDLDAQAKP